MVAEISVQIEGRLRLGFFRTIFERSSNDQVVSESAGLSGLQEQAQSRKFRKLSDTNHSKVSDWLERFENVVQMFKNSKLHRC